jgi:hypothetical protein
MLPIRNHLRTGVLWLMGVPALVVLIGVVAFLAAGAT